MSKITLASLYGCKLRHVMHLDGPRGAAGWSGSMHECIEHPRLQRRIRFWKSGKKDLAWFVDGEEIGPKLEAALTKLNRPPKLNHDETEALEKITDEFVDLRFGSGISITTLLMLRCKGFIEFKDGKCRRRKQEVTP